MSVPKAAMRLGLVQPMLGMSTGMDSATLFSVHLVLPGGLGAAVEFSGTCIVDAGRADPSALIAAKKRGEELGKK